MSGTRNGEDWPTQGQTADLPTGEAQHLVAAGIAAAVPEQPETATAPEPETATAPLGKRAPGRLRKGEGTDAKE
ncbi:hypothetical protein [Streptomyces sp. NPDC051569]|uniref:hypothetical protein n=1 Tax=Streptomyces sp. NPDC051569 TaxID=3365661 RepID=UPI00379936C2